MIPTVNHYAHCKHKIYDICALLIKATLQQRVRCIVDMGARHGEGHDALNELCDEYVFIEPNPACIDVLVSRFTNAQHVTLLPYAVGSHAGTAKLITFSADDHQSSNLFSDRGLQYGDASIVDVQCINHRDVCADSMIDFCKVNIEGSEYDLLEGDFFDRVGAFVIEAHNGLREGMSYVDVINAVSVTHALCVLGNPFYKYCFVVGVNYMYDDAAGTYERFIRSL